MPIKAILPLSLLTLLAALLLACTAAATPTPIPTPAPTATPPPPPQPLILGSVHLDVSDHLFSGSDIGSHEGPIVRSTRLAVKHVNDAGGVFGLPVEIHYPGIDIENPTPGDLWGLDAVADSLALLESDGVHAFLGPCSSANLGKIIEAIVIPQAIPFVSGCSTAPFIADTADGGLVFRTAISDAAQALALADLAEAEGFDHVALAHRDDPWGNGLAEAFKTHFDGEVSDIALHPEAATFADELHEIGASDAQALVIMTFHRQAIPVLDEVQEHGHFEELLLLGDLRSLEFLADHPEVLDGSKGVAFYGHHVSEAEGHWEADYIEEFGELDHRPYMQQSYDAAIALMLAFEYAGTTDGAAVAEALHIIGGPPGQHFPASAEGVRGALEAVRNGEDIDLDGEATDLDFDSRGEILIGHMGTWEFRDGEIVDLEFFDVDISQ